MTAQGSEALANKEKELYQTIYSEALGGLESVRDRIIELQKEWTAIEIEESLRRGIPRLNMLNLCLTLYQR